MPSVPLSQVAPAFAASFLLLQRNDDASPFVACGCLGFFGLIMVGIIALNIALLIWSRATPKAGAWTTRLCG
jgi:hypothetical protein